MSEPIPFQHPWPEKLLGEVAKVTVGGTPSTAIARYWDGDVPWMASGDIHLGRIFDVPGRITDVGLNASNATLVKPDSVAIALAGQGKTRGTVALTKITLCTNQSVALISPDERELLPDYLYQALIPRYEELRNRSAGGGRAGLTKAILEQVPVQLPLLTEQRAIAEILSVMDEQIEQTEALIQKIELEKLGLMQRFLEPSLEWAKAEALGTLVSKGGGSVQTGPFGSQLHEHDYVVDGTPIITVEHILTGKIEGEHAPRVGRRDVQRLSRYSLQEGDIVFSRVGAIDRSAYVDKEHHGWLFSGRLLRVRPGTKLNSKFLAYLLGQELQQRWIYNHSVGSTMLCLNTKILSDTPIRLPSAAMQDEAVELLDETVAELNALKAEATKLCLQKQGLMRDLLTGRVRIQ